MEKREKTREIEDLLRYKLTHTDYFITVFVAFVVGNLLDDFILMGFCCTWNFKMLVKLDCRFCVYLYFNYIKNYHINYI